MKESKQHKLKFNPYLEKLYQSNKPLIIYKVEGGYDIYTDFSKKIILTNKNIKNFFNQFTGLKKKKKPTYLLDFLDMKYFVIY